MGEDCLTNFKAQFFFLTIQTNFTVLAGGMLDVARVFFFTGVTRVKGLNTLLIFILDFVKSFTMQLMTTQCIVFVSSGITVCSMTTCKR